LTHKHAQFTGPCTSEPVRLAFASHLFLAP
jgi:hypothetical protein